MLLESSLPIPYICKLNKSFPRGPTTKVSYQKDPVMLYLQP